MALSSGRTGASGGIEGSLRELIESTSTCSFTFVHSLPFVYNLHHHWQMFKVQDSDEEGSIVGRKIACASSRGSAFLHSAFDGLSFCITKMIMASLPLQMRPYVGRNAATQYVLPRYNCNTCTSTLDPSRHLPGLELTSLLPLDLSRVPRYTASCMALVLP